MEIKSVGVYRCNFRKGLENGKAELANVSNGAVAITIIPAKGYKN